jgi:phage gp45-like
MIARVAAAVRNLVTRGKVTKSIVGARTLLQITGLQGEVKATVELLLPPGYSARPKPGADVTLFQVLGSRDHVVALGGDSTGQVIADLAEGEFGLTDGTRMVIFRHDHLHMTSPTYVLIDTPTLRVTGDILDNCNSQTRTIAGMRTVYDAHRHGGVQTGSGTSGAPNSTM